LGLPFVGLLSGEIGHGVVAKDGCPVFAVQDENFVIRRLGRRRQRLPAAV